MRISNRSAKALTSLATMTKFSPVLALTLSLVAEPRRVDVDPDANRLHERHAAVDVERHLAVDDVVAPRVSRTRPSGWNRGARKRIVAPCWTFRPPPGASRISGIPKPNRSGKNVADACFTRFSRLSMTPHASKEFLMTLTGWHAGSIPIPPSGTVFDPTMQSETPTVFRLTSDLQRSTHGLGTLCTSSRRKSPSFTICSKSLSSG